MKDRSRANTFAIVTLASAFGLVVMVARAQFGTAKPSPSQASPASPAGAAPKTAAEAFKNIQVLKNIPADELMPSMQFITASLGVRCDYCHVEHAFDKDDKQPKRTARKMMQMMFAINKDNFHGHRVVTCYSCHHGATHPVGIPIIAEEGAAPELAANMSAGGGMSATAGASAAALPTADQLVDKYIQALGGADALQKLTSRVEKGTLSGFGGHEFPVEIYAKAPFQRMSAVQTPHGEMVTAYNGHAGWLGGMGRPPHPMSLVDLPAARLEADFYFPFHIKQDFTRLRVMHPDKVGGQEAYAVVAFKEGQPPVRLYFDEQSGLLVRLVDYEDTPLGLNPTQFDYADYRDQGAVKTPFQWTIARPEGRFTIKVNSIQQNVPIDDSKFAEPPQAAAAGQKPSAP
ncbi:MAG: c-type cytochrome [Terriglobia bacterium]